MKNEEDLMNALKMVINQLKDSGASDKEISDATDEWFRYLNFLVYDRIKK